MLPASGDSLVQHPVAPPLEKNVDLRVCVVTVQDLQAADLRRVDAQHDDVINIMLTKKRASGVTERTKKVNTK